jgi:uncharacterized membrane protein
MPVNVRMKAAENAYNPQREQYTGEKPMVSKKTLNTLLASAVALTVAGAATAAHAQNEKEKCYGVVKAGKNDCASASGSHSCHAQAATDGAGDEWVAVPAGLCDRLVNGSVTPVSTGAPPAAAEAPAAEAPATDAPAAAPAEGH